MKRFLDIDNWDRKEHFYFFKDFEEPFFGISIDVDCTETYRTAKEGDISFFLHYLHKSLKAANKVEPFRYRIDESDRVVIYDQVNASPTIQRKDGTFGYAYLPYFEDLDTFSDNSTKVIEEVMLSHILIPSAAADNVIHYSSIPWISFTGISHARRYGVGESIPKISFGKVFDRDARKILPVSVHVHHALMDGLHVGQYLDLFQKLLSLPLGS